MLRKYYVQYKPIDYLFEGQDTPMYSARSIQLILKAACQKAGIKKNVTIHSCRTVLRYTCSKTVPTYATYNSFWDMKAARPPKYIPL